MNIDNINTSKAVLNSIFNSQSTAQKKQIQQPKTDFKQEDIDLIETKPSKTIDVADIQKYAQQAGENLTLDDINYGLTYGRSVIADYIA